MRVCAMIAGRESGGGTLNRLLAQKLPVLYHDFGVRKIIAGIHRGAELSALHYLLNRREEFPALKIDGVFTHEEEANHWAEAEREMLYRAVARCDEELILKPVFGNEMRFQRNIVMMDLADLVLLLGRDGEAEFWAAKLGKPLLIMDAEQQCCIPDLRLYRRSG